jgi:hypothetical protein
MEDLIWKDEKSGKLYYIFAACSENGLYKDACIPYNGDFRGQKWVIIESEDDIDKIRYNERNEDFFICFKDRIGI